MAELNDIRRAATKHGWTDRMNPHHPIRTMLLTRRMSPDIGVSFRQDGSLERGFADFGIADGTAALTFDEVLELLTRPEAPSEFYTPTTKEP